MSEPHHQHGGDGGGEILVPAAMRMLLKYSIASNPSLIHHTSATAVVPTSKDKPKPKPKPKPSSLPQRRAKTPHCSQMYGRHYSCNRLKCTEGITTTLFSIVAKVHSYAQCVRDDHLAISSSIKWPHTRHGRWGWWGCGWGEGEGQSEGQSECQSERFGILARVGLGVRVAGWICVRVGLG